MDKKVIFIAFAIEDVRQRDLFTGQSIHPMSPFEFIDMSVKQPYDTGWKDRVRTRIRRSDGVILLVSKNSILSTGQEWEVNCALEEKKPILGIWAYSNDTTRPSFMKSVTIISWSWQAITDFIDSL